MYVGSCDAGSLRGFSVFFFKQKTAYEMLRSLVGSEMCIRDSFQTDSSRILGSDEEKTLTHSFAVTTIHSLHWVLACLLYTSDAADDLLCVDLGGRRIIKKKKSRQYDLCTLSTKYSYLANTTTYIQQFQPHTHLVH